ncbi:MAG TPA: DUF6603 domain-containing protein [Pyrinomonadaceae bacterium]
MSGNAQDALLVRLAVLLAPLRVVAESEYALRDMAASVGWDLDEITGLPVVELQTRLNQFATSFDTLTGALDPPPETLAALGEVLDAAESAFEAVRAIASVLAEGAQPSHFKEFGRDLVSAMTIAHLQTHAPVLYHLAVLLTIVEPADREALSEPVFDSAGHLVRVPHTRPKLHLGRIIDLIESPEDVLREEYVGPNGLQTAADAQRTADKLFPRLAALLAVLGADAVYGFKPQYGIDLGDPDSLAAGTLAFWIETLAGSAQVGAMLSLSPAERGNLGLVVSPFGSITLEELIGKWTLRTSLTAGIDAFAVGPDGVRLLFDPTSGDGDRVAARVEVERQPEPGTSVTRFGSETGTRFEAERLRILAEAKLSAAEQEFGLLAEVVKAAIVVAPGEGDGFLKKILPDDGLRATFELAAGWSNKTGFYFRGGAGLEAQLPLHVSLGPLTVESVTVGVRVDGEGVETEVSGTASLKLGPLTAVVERMGLTATVTFPDDGGNLGAADLSVGFKPPTGVGLSIRGGGFEGGGFLSYDRAQARYTGVLQLEFEKKISLKAIGLLDTRLPSGASGFSLLIVISAEFQPIQLGLGFTLNGVGGLLGLHRTAREDVLRAGLRTNALSSILFPVDPIANAPRIISDLAQVFPVAEGRFIFGPAARIGWGTPTLLTIDLALIIEVPSPVRVLILGVVRALLPDKDAPLLKLQINFLGVIDFERKRLAFDASLFESRLLAYTLEGDMAVRADWGDDPSFLLSVGGFHPAFNPPAELAGMRRLSLNLLGRDNPRLLLEAYFAVTSNTVQFGARIELYAAASKFNVYGYLGFDTLFQFSPFSFTAEISAGLALRVGSRRIMAVELKLTLTGPGPFRARGKAKFKIIFFHFSVSFDVTWGDVLDAVMPAANVLALLTDALRRTDNWLAELPAARSLLVTVKELAGLPDVLIHPAGTLVVSQRVVPLDLKIAKFGNARPEGPDLFRITRVVCKGDTLPTTPEVQLATVEARDEFAPAQFREMTDAERLASKSFEKLKSGVRLRASEELQSSYCVTRDVEYESIIIDHEGLRAPLPPVRDSFGVFAALVKGSAVSKSSLSAERDALSPLGPRPVGVGREGFAVVSAADLKPATGVRASAFASETEAAAHLAELIEANPRLAGEVQVVPAYEVNAL